jgi:hypothetical protein
MFWNKQKKQTTIKRERQIAVNKIYTDKFGNDWFEYVNNLTIPARRTINAEVATRFAEMNLTKSELMILIDAMKKNANTGNIVELFSVLSEIEFRLNFIGEEKTLMELAVCYFIIDGEDETQFSDEWQNKKREILNADSDAKDFFLQKAFERTIQFGNTSETDIINFLRKAKAENEKLNQYLQTLKLENTLMT